MGLEFGQQNPRAATHIVMQQFPGLASQMTPSIATESMMELANVFRGDFAKRQGWGWADMDSWALFLQTIYKIGQVSREIDPASVIKNDYIPAANAFDKAKLSADAQGYALPPEYQSVDVETIRAKLLT